MKRREFITLLGGAAAWPLAARAQQRERMRRIGVLVPAVADDPVWQARLGAFLQALALLGWTIGRNVHIDTRWGTPNADEIRRQAAEIAALAPDVILAGGSSTVGPLLQATRTVPIVFTLGNDPVGSGFVDSLARPGGNATGFMSYEFSIAGKWLELLKEIAPGVTRVAVLRDTSQAFATSMFATMQAVAPPLGVEVIPVNMRNAAEMSVLGQIYQARDVISGCEMIQMQQSVCRRQTYSITSSARSRTDVGKSSPSALAVLRLITSSVFVDC